MHMNVYVHFFYDEAKSNELKIISITIQIL
jgi:hypothetical protein